VKQVFLSFIEFIFIVIDRVRARNGYLGYKLNLHSYLWEEALVESANFVRPYLDKTMVCRNKREVWDMAIREMSDIGILNSLEFGVYGGGSLNYMAKKMPKVNFFGFDSFEGLKVDWVGHHARKGAFNRNGEMPKVEQNVTLVKGWFNETVPTFFEEHDFSSPIFVHIDGDTYEAANAVFESPEFRLPTGSIILFDEYIGYPNWKNGEYKAWQEYADKNKITYEYLAFSTDQALIKIK